MKYYLYVSFQVSISPKHVMRHDKMKLAGTQKTYTLLKSYISKSMSAYLKSQYINKYMHWYILIHLGSSSNNIDQWTHTKRNKYKKIRLASNTSWQVHPIRSKVLSKWIRLHQSQESLKYKTESLQSTIASRVLHLVCCHDWKNSNVSILSPTIQSLVLQKHD